MSKKNNSLRTAAVHLSLLLFVVYLVFPMIWIIVTSLKTTPEIYSGVFSLIPKTPTLAHFQTIIAEGQIFRSMLNSLFAGVISTVLVVIIAMPAAYALVRYQSLLNRFFMGWILTSQIFPAILIIVPLYLVIRFFHLTDTLLGLALVYVVWSLPFILWMLFGYMKNIPVELEEAAAIDGASRLQIVYLILMPVLLPAIGASALFAFISAWNEFFFALVLLKSPETITLPVELARLTGIEGQARTGPLAAASIIATVPSIVLFSLMRKWFSGGLLAGSIK